VRGLDWPSFHRDERPSPWDRSSELQRRRRAAPVIDVIWVMRCSYCFEDGGGSFGDKPPRRSRVASRSPTEGSRGDRRTALCAGDRRNAGWRTFAGFRPDPDFGTAAHDHWKNFRHSFRCPPNDRCRSIASSRAKLRENSAIARRCSRPYDSRGS
jgi:hypothetical protein